VDYCVVATPETGPMGVLCRIMSLAHDEIRAPFQVLAIPFRRTMAGSGFAVLKRSDADCGRLVAGRGAGNETPVQAALRETQEEVGITYG